MLMMMSWTLSSSLEHQMMAGSLAGIKSLIFIDVLKDRYKICSFGRSINGTGTTQDVNLGGDYYVLFGRSGSQSPGILSTHTGNENPSVSADLVSVLNAIEAPQPSPNPTNGVTPNPTNGVTVGIEPPHALILLLLFFINIMGQ